MRELTIRSLVDPAEGELEKVGRHYQLMYEELRVEGRRITDAGIEQWIDSTKRVLDRTLFAEVAELNGEMIGSIYGAIMMTPAYLGGERIAMVHHIYVVPEHRALGVAKKLAIAWIERMKEKGITAFQLHVTTGNEAGMAFWENMGFKNELSQLALRYPIR